MRKELPVSRLVWASVGFIKSIVEDPQRSVSTLTSQVIIKALFGVPGDDDPSIYAMTDGLIKSVGPENHSAILEALTNRSVNGPIWLFSTEFGMEVVLSKIPQEDGTNAIELTMYYTYQNDGATKLMIRRLVTYSAGMDTQFGFTNEATVENLSNGMDAPLYRSVEVEDEHVEQPNTADGSAETSPESAGEPTDGETIPDSSEGSDGGIPSAQTGGTAGDVDPASPSVAGEKLDVRDFTTTFNDSDNVLQVREANKILTVCNKLIEQNELDIEKYADQCKAQLKKGHEVNLLVEFDIPAKHVVVHAWVAPEVVNTANQVQAESAAVVTPVQEPSPEEVEKLDDAMKELDADHAYTFVYSDIQPSEELAEKIQVKMLELLNRYEGRTDETTIQFMRESLQLSNEFRGLTIRSIVGQIVTLGFDPVAEVKTEVEPSPEVTASTEGTIENPPDTLPPSSDETTPVEQLPDPPAEIPVPAEDTPPAEEVLDLEDPMIKRNIVQSLFPNVLDPSYNHIKTFLSDYHSDPEHPNETYLATRTFPIETTIVYDNITLAIVKMFDGKAYRIYAAKTDRGLQKHDWVSTHEMEGRWHQVCPEICLPNFGGGGYRRNQRYGRGR